MNYPETITMTLAGLTALRAEEREAGARAERLRTAAVVIAANQMIERLNHLVGELQAELAEALK